MLLSKIRDARKDLLLFFDRPTQPIFMPKGVNKIRFNIPDSYYTERYRKYVKLLKLPLAVISHIASHIASHRHPEAGDDNLLATGSASDIPVTTQDEDSTIDVEEIKLPDLSLPMQLPWDSQFSFFIKSHSEMAGKLIEIFLSMPSLKELISLLVYCQPRINPYMFNYCLSIAILHRPDTKGMNIPTFAETFPNKFVDRQALFLAREYVAVIPEGTPVPDVIIEFSVNEYTYPEQRMAYFREDIGVNSHHWHWHLIYPTAGPPAVMKRNRRGELFYYMHHQIMARYNVERMCNGLERAQPYDNWREPIANGYFSNLDSGNASRIWPPRFDNVNVRDVNNKEQGVHLKISDVETAYEHILAAIQSQSIVQSDGSQLPLDEETGIDILGNIVEASSLTINSAYYGNYHNNGHMLVAYVHDPDGRHMQQHAVMGDAATAMRDPFFYRWHSTIDEIFTVYKDKLTPYGPDKLVFPGVSVESIRLESVEGNNTISTLWERSAINLSNGLDFARECEVLARFTHLQHELFDYVIEVNNTSSESHVGTVRLFMAPTVDESGKPLTYNEQRLMVIEMDKFSQPLSPGKNTIRRSSKDSSVTIPFERIFRDKNGEASSDVDPKLKFCECGWPQYLLVPRGTKEGYPVVIFVMVSNWKEDKVETDVTGAKNDNASYCGLRDTKYPDRRAMGFPFDRKPAPGINSLRDFLQPNMAFINCTIKFTDRTRDRDYGQGGAESETHKQEGDNTTTGEHGLLHGLLHLKDRVKDQLKELQH